MLSVLFLISEIGILSKLNDYSGYYLIRIQSIYNNKTPLLDFVNLNTLAFFTKAETNIPNIRSFRKGSFVTFRIFVSALL